MKKIAILALTDAGITMAKKINEKMKTSCPVFVPEKKLAQGLQVFPAGTFKESCSFFFSNYEGLICIMASGIVVRSIADAIRDKRTDPAVVVLDEKGGNVISLLSGHVGGGNQLARRIAQSIGSNPVITTATDVQDVTAVDMLAKEINGWYDSFSENTRWINGLLASHEKVGLIQDVELVSDLRGLTVLREGDDLEDFKAVLWVTARKVDCDPGKVLQVVPRRFVLGAGTKKGISYEQLKEEYLNFCGLQGIHPMAVSKIASIDLKKEEPGILALARWLEAEFLTFSKEELAETAEKYPQSAFVKETAGVGSVSLASADLAGNGNVISKRYANQGVTLALGEA